MMTKSFLKKLRLFFSDFRVITLLLTLSIGMFQIFLGEKIPVAEGMGWDGRWFGHLAGQWTHIISHKEIDGYQVHRIIPSMLVHFGLKWAGIPFNAHSVFTAFQIFNLVMLLLAAYTWSLIARTLQLTSKGQWLGYFSLFLNYAMLKEFYYSPVMTDVAAFTLGILLFYCFLKNKMWGILIICIIGAFTWPIILYSGIALYLFPMENLPLKPAVKRFHIASAFILVLAIIALLYYADFTNLLYIPNGGQQIIEPVKFLSILCVLVYLFYGTKYLANLNYLFDFRYLSKAFHPIKVLTAFVLLIFVSLIAIEIRNPQKLALNQFPLYFLTSTLGTSIMRPLNFIVSHVVWYGPVLLLSIFYWDKICNQVHKYGIGLTASLLIGFTLSIGAVSRQLVIFFVFIIIFTVKIIDQIPLQKRFYPSFCILSLLYSKIWFKMNSQIPFTGEYWDFPYQYYFMNNGGLMSHGMYVVQGIFVFLTGLFFYRLLHQNQKSSTS